MKTMRTIKNFTSLRWSMVILLLIASNLSMKSDVVVNSKGKCGLKDEEGNLRLNIKINNKFLDTYGKHRLNENALFPISAFLEKTKVSANTTTNKNEINEIIKTKMGKLKERPQSLFFLILLFSPFRRHHSLRPQGQALCALSRF